MGADVVNITDVLVEDDPNLQQTAESQGSMLAQVAVSQGWVHSNATAEAIRKMGRKSLAIKMDVTNREQVRDVFKKVKDEFGKIDILINNAATLDHAAQIPNQSYELWDRDAKVNLNRCVQLHQRGVALHGREQSGGGSSSCPRSRARWGGFGQASDSGDDKVVIGLAKTAALEGGRHNITASPHRSRHHRIRGREGGGRQQSDVRPLQGRTVFKRFGQPEDIANTIGFLCTEEAGDITGAVIEVAGGIPLFTA